MTTSTTSVSSDAVLVLSNWNSGNKPMVVNFEGYFGMNFVDTSYLEFQEESTIILIFTMKMDLILNKAVE